MPSLLIRCACGKVIPVAAQHRGRQIKCLRCARLMPVPHAVSAVDWWRNSVILVTERVSHDLSHVVTRVRGRRVAQRHAVPVAGSALARHLSRATWAWLGVTIVVAAILRGFGDAWWPGTVLLFSSRWIFLVPVALLTPVALVVRRLLVPVALSALVVGGPLMGFRTAWRRTLPHPGGAHFRIVTFNADNSLLVVAEIPLLLGEWEADVVALQECGEPMAQAIARLPGWHHHVVRQLCLLSRHPIVESRVMDRTALELVNSNAAARIGGAGDVARYTLRTRHGLVSVTNLHLETPRKGLQDLRAGFINLSRLDGNTRLRGIESSLARQWVDSGRAPFLVAGDFNTPVESRIFERSWGDLTDAFSRAGFGFGYTKFDGWIRVRIDHVLSGPGWYVDRAIVARDVGSDHRPLVVDLTLAAASGGTPR